jgi:hypothetical protein
MSARKLWKVEQSGYRPYRPESKTKVYDIYVPNLRGRWIMAGRPEALRYADVSVDERDGRGWQLFERVDLSNGEAAS